MTDYAALLAQAKVSETGAERLVVLRAAQGDVEAQRALVDAFAEAGSLGPFNMASAVVMARLVAAHGRVADWRRLAGLLMAMALWVRDSGAYGWEDASEDFAGEALAIYAQLSDEGDAESNDAIAHLAPLFPKAWDEAQKAELLLFHPAPTPPPIVYLREMPELPRALRMKLWLLDRWWGFTGALSDAVWPVRLRWWNLKDAVTSRLNGEK